MFIQELIGAIAQVLLFALIPFIVWLITARKKMNFFRWIGFTKPTHKGNIILTLVFTLVGVLAYGFLSIYFINTFSGDVTSAGSSFAGQGMSAIPATIAYGFIRTGLSEEIVFRGFILKRIANKFGFIAGNLIQSILFGLLHGVPFGLATQNIGVTIALTLLPAAMGFLMGYLNEKKFSNSIIPSWILHGTINTVVSIFSL